MLRYSLRRYACLNMDLREQRPPIFTNRGCIQITFKEKGLDYVSGLALENCRALAGIIQWNHEKGIRLFRCGLAVCANALQVLQASGPFGKCKEVVRQTMHCSALNGHLSCNGWLSSSCRRMQAILWQEVQS